MDTQTLPLFEGTTSEARSAEHPAQLGNAPQPGDPRQHRNGNAHLRAVRRLYRDVRRAKHRSPQQTRAGQLICRHLIALLQSEESSPDRPH